MYFFGIYFILYFIKMSSVQGLKIDLIMMHCYADS